MRKGGVCDNCKWCYEDSLSCELDYYNSCHNELSENYLFREDDMNWLSDKDYICPDFKPNN